MSETIDLLEIEREQSLEDSAASLRAVAALLDTAEERVTVAHGGESTTVPAPERAVEFELEVEREPGDDTDEIEIEVELEWDVPARDEEADTDDEVLAADNEEADTDDEVLAVDDEEADTDDEDPAADNENERIDTDDETGGLAADE